MTLEQVDMPGRRQGMMEGERSKVTSHDGGVWLYSREGAGYVVR